MKSVQLVNLNIINRYNKILPNYIYELELEQLSNEPVLESKKLMQYCNLPWSEKCLEFHKKKKTKLKHLIFVTKSGKSQNLEIIYSFALK